MKPLVFIKDGTVQELFTVRVDYLREGKSALGWFALARGSFAFLGEDDRRLLWGPETHRLEDGGYGVPAWFKALPRALPLSMVVSAIARTE